MIKEIRPHGTGRNLRMNGMGTDVFYGADQSLLHHVDFGRLAARAADQLAVFLARKPG
jgi:hypothetical protein